MVKRLTADEDWWRRVDSNHRHRAYETPALPTELRRHGRSYDTSPEGGFAADQRIIKKRTDGVKARLTPFEDAACVRAAHPPRPRQRDGRGFASSRRRWVSCRSRSISFGS